MDLKRFHTNDTPRVYVACLGAYNAGKYVGEWVDADSCLAETVKELTQKWHAIGGHEYGDEWAIHDHEFGLAWPGGEYPDLDKVGELGEALEEHGDAFAAYLTYVDTSGRDIWEIVDEFIEDYAGDDTEANTAQEYAEDAGYIDFGSGNPLTYCIDWQHAYKELGFYNVLGYNFRARQ